VKRHADGTVVHAIHRRKRRKASQLPRALNCNTAMPTTDADGVNDVYDVEAIVGHRHKNGQEEYLIKWVGYPKEENAWEPKSNLNKASLEDAKAYRNAKRKKNKVRKIQS
jgi:hypothetical protein